MMILVTGGNGFIGAKIVERLVSLGHQQFLILRKNSNRERLFPFINKIKILEADLTQADVMTDIVRKINPDVIIHLASYGVYSYSDMTVENVQLMVNTNIHGTINLLHAANNTNCKIVINTGSCFEYGSSESSFKEEDMLNPVNMYGVTKASATLFSQVFSKKSKFSLVTLRPFTVYGPGEDKRRFISTVIRQCLQGISPSLTSESIVRDYIYVEDVVDAYLVAISKGEKFSGQVINISTGKDTALKDVVGIIIKLTHAKVVPNIGSFPRREGEVLNLVGDSTKSEKLLNWKAKHSLEEGLNKTIKWVKEND